MQLILDVIGGCNLKCPSCPVGNTSNAEKAVWTTKSRAMPLPLFESIVDKARATIPDLEFIALYNWTEPLMHPQLPEMVGIVKSRGIPCHLSSNLNVLRDPDALAEANPDYLRISLSGFTQRTYGKHHRGGNIEVVKENIARLLASKKKAKATTDICMLFHRYLDNLDEEDQIKTFAARNGIRFEASWAYLMPLEKLMAYSGADAPDAGTRISDEDWDVIASLALPLDQAIYHARRYRRRKCWLKENQIVLDHAGNVILCCGVFNQQDNIMGTFLDMSADDLRTLISRDSRIGSCAKCTKDGLHVLAVYGMPEIDALARGNVSLFGQTAQARKQ